MTEEIKKEADKVYRKYYDIWIKSDMTIKFEDFIKIVIQDRQSVLEENKDWYKLLKVTATESSYLPIKQRIQSLTQQIEYLKSKLQHND